MTCPRTLSGAHLQQHWAMVLPEPEGQSEALDPVFIRGSRASRPGEGLQAQQRQDAGRSRA